MTVFHYIPLVGGLFNFCLSLFVLGCDRRSRLNQVFFVWGIGITIWNLGTYAMFRVGNPEDAFVWARFLQYGVIVLPPTLLHLSLLIAGRRVGRWIAWLYGLHFVLLVMNANGLFISGVRDLKYAYYSIAGPGFWIYTLSLTQTFVSVAVLWTKRQSLPPRQRSRFNSILAAQALIVIFGTNDILPILGVNTYPLTNEVPILPYGSLAAVAYGVMVAYSVFQHQLLDVHLALGRSAAHIVRFVFLVVIGLALELCVAAFAPEGAIGTYALVSTIIVLMVSLLIASFLFPKLLGGAAEDLERRLLGDRFEYQDQIRIFIEQSRWRSELPSLLRDLHLLLINTLRVRSYSVILLDETSRAFTLKQAHPPQSERQIAELSSNSPVFRFFHETDREYLTLHRSYGNIDDSKGAEEARAQLHPFDGAIVFPLIAEDQAMGLLILGDKVSGEPFTRTDTQLMISLTENLALVIHQISLKNQLLLNQELDLLGRMSRGMAHDLNNLTTPVWTMLQLIGEGVPAETLRHELVPVAIRNIQTMRAYIKEALFFSENLRPDFQFGRLDVLIHTVVDLARENPRRGKTIRFSVDTGGETLVEMDSVLIQRLLTNIIANGVDASPDDRELRVQLIRLVKTDPHIDWLRVRVTDFGTGIPTEDLDRIFQPYFSTKKTGDENRGFGLGLAICRKIASLHGGSLTVQSQLGQGTTFNLDLPSRQKAGISNSIAQVLATPTPQPAGP
jgi:signal transduction histidine kinase